MKVCTMEQLNSIHLNIFEIFRFDIRGWLIKQFSIFGVPVLSNEITNEIQFFFVAIQWFLLLLLEVALIFIDLFYKK